ncbi:hypothetical protein KIOSHI_237 [Bacillus phage Kioshi]|nr:hypothetical protein KIOSHI_237 [Bacillus phage Kioshi]
MITYVLKGSTEEMDYTNSDVLYGGTDVQVAYEIARDSHHEEFELTTWVNGVHAQTFGSDNGKSWDLEVDKVSTTAKKVEELRKQLEQEEAKLATLSTIHTPQLEKEGQQ